ncbi:hypothetical protein BA062_09915 [Prauserella flavalba]|uniref:Lipopolysaccharide assembly protein A domain-containing protein n=1 Tax=Prauserella flavalba TaxID=1477506 RepID=A0A318LQV1_9PSEU|nr:hypothetical protein BA062_09915 [Prauserella flavalba]
MAPPTGARAQPERVVKRTRISAAWVAAIVGVLVLILLLIFILQNQDSATVNFLWMSGSLPVGVGVLLAAVGGALLVALLGAARILQLRHRFRKANGGRHQA